MAKKPPPPTHVQQSSKPVQHQTVTQQWHGPLPPPGALAQFNQIIPNGAERIMAMVEQEQAHRIGYESKRLDVQARDFRWGQILGFALSISCVAGAIYTAVIGAHPSVSIALVSMPIIAAVRAFLNRKS